MDGQLARRLAELLRENMTLRADNNALANMLNVAELTGEVPVDWRSMLEETRKTHMYRNLAEAFEPLLHHIEQTCDETAIEKLLQEIPPAQLEV